MTLLLSSGSLMGGLTSPLLLASKGTFEDALPQIDLPLADPSIAPRLDAILEGRFTAAGGRELTIGRGGWGGGGSEPPNSPADELNRLCANGEPPVSSSRVGDIVQRYQLGDRLQGGEILTWEQAAGPGELSRLFFLACLPARRDQVMRVIMDIDHWEDWVIRYPYFKSTEPQAISIDDLYRRYIVDRTFRLDRNAVAKFEPEGPFRFHVPLTTHVGRYEEGALFRLQLRDDPTFETEPGWRPVAKIDIWLLAVPCPGDPDKSLLMQHIHFAPADRMLRMLASNLGFVRDVIQSSSVKEYALYVQAFANRALDNTWSSKHMGSENGRHGLDMGRASNPSGMRYYSVPLNR